MSDTSFSTLAELKVATALATGGATLGDVRREMKSSALAKFTDLSEEELTASVDSLVAAGLAARNRDIGTKEDTYWISLTQSGLAAYQRQVAELEAAAES